MSAAAPGVSPRPSLAAGDGADAALLALAAQFRRVDKRHDAALAALAAAEERRVTPAPPPALLRRREDRELPFHLSAARIGEAYGEEDVRLLRHSLGVHKRAGRRPAPIPPAMRARIGEILAAAKDFERATYDAGRQAGLYRANARFDRACYARQELYSKIGRQPAATLAGLLAKLMVAASGVETFANDFADETQIEFILASAVADALQLAGGAQAQPRLAAIREALGLATP